MMELVDEAEQFAPQPGPAVIVEPRSFLAAKPDRALEAALEQADSLQERRLARTRGPKQRDDLTGRNRQG